MSSYGSPIEGISKFIDYHLSPLVRKISSYIHQGYDGFLKKLEGLGYLPSGTILATLDVTALYTTFLMTKGLKPAEPF